MRNVPSTRYVHQATEPCRVDNSDRMRNVPSTRYVPGDTEPCKVDMIERAKTFLNTATKNREPKQQYVSRNHCLPHSSTFCILCRMYKSNLHYCVALNRYVNVDERQMLLIEGDTEAEVVGMENNTGKATLFENRRIMKFVLFNRVGIEKLYKKTKTILSHNLIQQVWQATTHLFCSTSSPTGTTGTRSRCSSSPTRR